MAKELIFTVHVMVGDADDDNREADLLTRLERKLAEEAGDAVLRSGHGLYYTTAHCNDAPARRPFTFRPGGRNG